MGALTIVVLLVFVIVGFIRGLESSLTASGDPRVVLVHSLTAAGSLESSAIPARTPGLLSASLEGIQRRFGVLHVSPELYQGTRVREVKDGDASLGIVRGVTRAAPLVRRGVRILEGRWPGPGEVLAGRMAAAKLGWSADRLAVGEMVFLEGCQWHVSGRFAAGGATLESELWCPLVDLQHALKRQDLSLVAMLLRPEASPFEVELFCKERVDLELAAVAETGYYAAMEKHYRPVRLLAWVVAVLIAGAGVFAGINTMYGAVAGRVRELAALQAIGFHRRAILLSLVQEATLLAAGGCLVAETLALTLLNGMAVRFTMGAFALRIDGTAVIIGCGTGLLIGAVGAIPPAVRAMRRSVSESLKAV